MNSFNENKKLINIGGKILPIQGSCEHLGSIIPMALVPANVPVKMPDNSIQQVNVFLTKTAQCIRCGYLWEFQHQTKTEETKTVIEKPKG
jgi:hypothetical protein